ncbi:hypothetical protein COCC4DRAFT_204965 [Bipolaris maydis ATCC 48331]|uniref:Uncharacterized protein n=2 Tax=Cochliobolus heterostrophus TaxID=5016 RepID=M2V5N9_COCH5|nr:uncharacterized protein COCC4DRAFT_204965 [Bipolaris maydis ATCC 48331]EMD95267.1 hypothetical protein COCHEDRAFT_1201657 [Bipolaris maydis C5]KAH7551145.1 hypothetical protein BM1_10019 [Bipolaris maydis]ENI00841.1 hypothetical protein COCC4DRAFT_204965 [Bipolaris maydis ATCC 48331]KAJ5021885.1 hypothetical protein J3E73DRAFT_385614 [Bipolaris maydis]KAJ6214279.1 hypothetical protein PSV09DRAFT_1201657 [Bipolaris maydis]
MSVPTTRFSNEDDMSLVNKCKAFIETYTMSQWDWWPLQPRVPGLTPGHLRLEWEFCGETLYETISLQESTLIQQTLDAMNEHPPKCYCCKVRPVQLSWTTIFEHIYHIIWKALPIKATSPSPTALTQLSKANLRYTPTRNTCANISPSLPHGKQPLPPQGSPPNGNFVFSIKDMWGFHNIENIENHSQLSDPMFFEELKKRHKSHRWCFQHWLSPYRFRYCRFVQFEEILDEHVSCVGEALPDHHGYTTDYEYDPRPPTAKMPLIDPTHFSVLLRACNTICYSSFLPVYVHKCQHIPADRRFLTRIPQKKGTYDASSRVHAPSLNYINRVAFGVEAGYFPSLAFFLAYHVFLILSGFSFWIYWMAYLPEDLQNASIPLFTIIMLIGTFWGLFGKRISIS